MRGEGAEVADATVEAEQTLVRGEGAEVADATVEAERTLVRGEGAEVADATVEAERTLARGERAEVAAATARRSGPRLPSPDPREDQVSRPISPYDPARAPRAATRPTRRRAPCGRGRWS